MKKFLKITLISLLVLSVLLAGGVYIYERLSIHEQEQANYHLEQKDIQKIKDGDIILRHGYGIISDIIVKRLNEKYHVSHCGIISKKKDKIEVIHSVSSSLSDIDGVQKQDFTDFIRQSKKKSIIIVRFKDSNRHKITQRAKYYLKQKVAFDDDFDINDTTSFFCTELVWKVIKDLYKIDIYRQKEENTLDYYKFDIFWENPNLFEIIFKD